MWSRNRKWITRKQKSSRTLFSSSRTFITFMIINSSSLFPAAAVVTSDTCRFGCRPLEGVLEQIIGGELMESTREEEAASAVTFTPCTLWITLLK